jgi:hypothetical protein
MACNSTGRFVWWLIRISGNLVKENLVETACELSRTHSWFFRAILPLENGSHPPAAIFDRVEKKHGCAGAQERRHQFVGSAIAKHELAEDHVESTALEEFNRLFLRGCEEDAASSFEQMVFESRDISYTISNNKNHDSAIHAPPFGDHCGDSGVLSHCAKPGENMGRTDFLDLLEERRQCIGA